MSTLEEWISFLLLIARSEGKVTAEDEEAIRQFAATLAERKFSLMTGVTVYLEYQAWRARRDAAKDEEAPGGNERLDAIEAKLAAIEAWINDPKRPRPRRLGEGR